MAQTIMHLLIADKIYSENYRSIRSYGAFLLGSIAPDAVHMREDCTRDLKRASHYRHTSFANISMSIFDPFFDEFAAPENRDFVAGYLVHLLSDMIWYHSIRAPFKEKFAQAPLHDLSMNEAYYADCEQIQELLFWEEDVPRIVNALRESRGFSLGGMIDAESVNAWKDKLILDYNNKRDILPHTQYISVQSIYDYITDCAGKCSEYLNTHNILSVED